MRVLLLLSLLWPALGYSGETWLAVPIASWHSNKEREGGKGGYEQTNPGLGLEYALNPHWRLAAGLYRSSIRTDTGYVGIAYLPLRYTFLGANLGIGTSAGVVSGYESNLLPVVVPTVVWERGNFGLNLMIIPETKQTKTAGIGLSLKFKLP